MNAFACPETPSATSPAPQSRLFLPPGRPRSVARRLAVRNRVLDRLRRFLTRRGYQEIPAAQPDVPGLLARMLDHGFPALWCEHLVTAPDTGEDAGHLASYRLLTLRGKDLDLPALADLMEDLLKDVTAHLGVELLGGRQVTRLDRSLQVPFPRLNHDQAVAAAGLRGWRLEPGQTFTPQIEATLVRHCGNLPLLLTGWPEGPKPDLAPLGGGMAARIKCIVPYAGEIMDGGVYADGRAGFSLGLNRLLQYVMGLGSVADTRIIPPEPRTARQARA